MQRQQRKAAKAASCPGGVKKPPRLTVYQKKGWGLFLVSPVSESLITAPLRREVNVKIMGPLPYLERPRVF